MAATPASKLPMPFSNDSNPIQLTLMHDGGPRRPRNGGWWDLEPGDRTPCTFFFPKLPTSDGNPLWHYAEWDFHSKAVFRTLHLIPS